MLLADCKKAINSNLRVPDNGVNTRGFEFHIANWLTPTKLPLHFHLKLSNFVECLQSPKLMTSPNFSTLTLQPRRLGNVIWSMLVALVICFVMSLYTADWKTTSLLFGTSCVLVTSLWLLRQKKPREASNLVLVTLTVSMSFVVYFSQGIRDPAVLAFPGIMVFASMFSTRRVFIAMVAFFFVALTFVAVSNLQGWHTNQIAEISVRTLGYTLTILTVTAFFVWLMATDLRTMMERLVLENERIRESNVQIDRLARHDTLTGLPNRLEVRDRFAHAMEVAQQTQSSIALLYFDLDDFKSVNDSLGHATGDLLLREIAQRLASSVRSTDMVSRHGGDEFLIVMTGVVDESAVTAMASKIITFLEMPFYVDGVELSTTCSIGIAMFPGDGSDFDSLMKGADMAMYRAKESGRNAFRYFDGTMNTGVVEHLHLVTGIRAALARNEFALYYQPQYELGTNEIIGAEALIRWNHPELGYIPPNKFVPIAERSGLIHELGKWVINEACRQVRDWQDAGISDLVVAINISAVQFRRDNIERDVINALSASGLGANFVELELTESLLMADSTSLTEMLVRLRALGLRLSIDDFGTGYSNLGYLKKFEVHSLKIDQSFIRRMTVNSNDAGIVRAIIEMAHSLGLTVVAEGIEDAETLQRLIELGCEYGQGFHWSPALPAPEFFDFYHANRLQ